MRFTAKNIDNKITTAKQENTEEQNPCDGEPRRKLWDSTMKDDGFGCRLSASQNIQKADKLQEFGDRVPERK